VGLYIVRAPAAASRLQVADNGLLKYLAKGSLPNDRRDSLFEPAGQIIDFLEWIAKLTSHIPEKGAQLVHYYGAYSNLIGERKPKILAHLQYKFEPLTLAAARPPRDTPPHRCS